VRALLALLCGALFSLAFPPVGSWPFALALAPVFLLVANSERARGAFLPGFAFGFGFFALHLLWLPQSFAPYSGGYFWFLYPPLVAVLGTFWGLVTYLGRLFGGRGVGTLWLLPAVWVLMEWARTQGVFAFPWGALGYIWVGTPFAQLADLAGVYGLSLLTASVVALVAAPFAFREEGRGSFWRAWVPALLVMVAAFGYGEYRLGAVSVPADETALLVQGNVDPYERTLEPGGEVGLYRRLTRTALGRAQEPTSLVVWPEGVTLEFLYNGGPDLTSPARAEARQQIQASAGGATVITGGGALDPRPEFSAANSAFSLSGGEIVGRYDKVYLVPFGEYFPFIGTFTPIYRTVFGWFGYPLLETRPPGEVIAPLELPQGSAAVYICYESVFPQVVRGMVAEGGEFLVNISNDAWFGTGAGAEQHFQMGTLRAIETRRYLLRAGNDGITALVDPLGEVRERLPRGGRGALEVRFGRSETVTPYVRYGDVLVLALAVYAAGVGVVSLLRR